MNQGAQVCTCDLNPDAVTQTQTAQPSLKIDEVDVRDETALTQWLARSIDVLGGCDVLVNNVGVAGPVGPLEQVSLEHWRDCMAINIDAQFIACRAVIPVMKAQKSGVILNMSSTSGLYGTPNRAAYTASKWAVIGLTKTLAIELGPHGIRCNAILPGLVAGDRIRRVIEAKAQRRGIAFKDAEAEALSKTSMQTYVTQRQLADQILLLCSERGRTISGQAISICGDTQMLM